MSVQSISSNEWTIYKLSELITLIGGGTPKTTNPEYWNGDIPWLSVKDFNNDSRYVYSTEKTITQLGLEASSTKLLEKDDIIISARGTVGEIAMIPFPMAFNQSCYGIRAKTDFCDSIFLYYLLKFNIRILKNNVHGSVFDTITRDTFDSLYVNLPPLPVQKKITSVLSSLDEKIELNTRMNKVLEEIARALFHRWFVEFEFPNAEGRPYKSSGGKMVESGMGSVPEGWEVGTLGDIVDVIDCLHSKKPERCKIGKPLLQLNNIRDDGLLDMSDIFFISEGDYSKWISRCEASKGDCVITNVGRVGAVAQIPEGVYAALGRNMTCIRCKTEYLFPSFLIEYLLSDPMRFEILNKTDTGTILDALNVKNIPKLRIVIPDIDTIKIFERILRPLRYKMEMNLKENLSLAHSRDKLLPKLMSGELPLEQIKI